MTELAGLNVTTNVDPLYSPEARSPEFLLVDEESASTYPLLTPSPPHFDHPLAVLDSNKVLAAYERQLSPSSIDPDLCNAFPPLTAPLGAADFGDVTGSNSANDKVAGPPDMTSSLHNTLETRSNGMASSSSSSSALQDAAASASAQLLNPHHYHNLAGDVACQENGGIIKPVLCSLRKTPDYCFVSWNWPLIRKFCFWSVMSLMVACVCIIITYVTTLPDKCDPQRAWYQGSLIYEIFPASFKDSNNDGIGDLRGISSKVEYLKTLGVRAVRLNSVFPAEHFPEHFYNIENFTNIEKTLGTMEDFRGMVKTLHKNNISVILDLPLYPYFKTLDARQISETKPQQKPPNLKLQTQEQHNLNPLLPNPTLDSPSFENNNDGLDNVRKQDKVRHVIVNNHILNGNLNKTDFQGVFSAISAATIQPSVVEDNNGPSLVSKVMEFWLKEGVDGFYLKGLEKFVDDDEFLGEIKSWHQILNSFSKIDAEKIMICSLKVVAAVENDGPLDVNVRLATVLTRFSLIDVYVEKADAVGDLVRYVQKGVVRSDPGFPWAMWTTGDVDLPRLASRLYLKNETLAVLAVQMMLPGTPSLFYGDEIGLDNIDDHDGERSDLSHAHSLAPMKWQSQNEAKQQFAKPLVLGWMPEAQTRAPRASTRVLSTMAALREGSPSIYMQANWKDKQLLTNCFIRYSEDNFILLERRYPRRFTYVVIANLGSTYKRKDLSTIFYGGHVIIDHNGNREGYVKFSDLNLGPGEFYIIRLDK